MRTLDKIKIATRKKVKPTNISKLEWANAVNWTIEAWKCYLNGQKWVHEFEVLCPEQYFMLIDAEGQLILPELKNVKFANNEPNREWSNRLRKQIIEMRARGEWNESMEWTKVLRQLVRFHGVSPNQDALEKNKAIKGHKLIRIKSAA